MNTTNAFLIAGALHVSIAACAFSQVDPATLVRRCDSACSAITALEYDAVLHRSAPGARDSTMRAHVVFRKMGSDATIGGAVRMEMSDGSAYTYDGARVSYRASSRAHVVVGDARTGGASLITEHFPGLMLSRFLTGRYRLARSMSPAGDIRDDGLTTVNGVQCRRLTLGSANNEVHTASVFSIDIGLDDYLPRRERTEWISEEGRTITEVEMAVLACRRDVDTASFESLMNPTDSVTYFTRPQDDALLRVFSPAPAWTLGDGDGHTLSSTDFGGRILILDFWYEKCGWCMVAMPALQKIYEHYRDSGVAVVGVDLMDADNDPLGFLRKRGITYNVGTRGHSMARRYHVTTAPVVYVIDSEGLVAFAQAGYSADTEERVAYVVETLLRDKTEDTRQKTEMSR